MADQIGPDYGWIGGEPTPMPEPPTPALPAGTYRVINGEFYRVEPGLPPSARIAELEVALADAQKEQVVKRETYTQNVVDSILERMSCGHRLANQNEDENGLYCEICRERDSALEAAQKQVAEWEAVGKSLQRAYESVFWELKSERTARERSEANCAALREALEQCAVRPVGHRNDSHQCMICKNWEPSHRPISHKPDCILAREHPGDKLRERVAKLEADNKEMRARYACPDCGCATSGDALAQECGCDTPCCSFDADNDNTNLSAEFNKIFGELCEAHEKLASEQAASKQMEEDNKWLMDALQQLMGGNTLTPDQIANTCRLALKEARHE